MVLVIVTEARSELIIEAGCVEVDVCSKCCNGGVGVCVGILAASTGSA